MLKSMVFIDYQNFNIAARGYYRSKTHNNISINYHKLVHKLNDIVGLDTILVKTYLFAYKPSDQLLELDSYSKYYEWLVGMKGNNYFEVIEGRQEVRPINKDIEINISDTSTYTTEEKGTDVNLAVTMLSKAYSNAFDVAILVSGDTDYIPVVEVLHQLGKVVVIASVEGQNISKYNALKDAHININLNLLNHCKNERRVDNDRS